MLLYIIENSADWKIQIHTASLGKCLCSSGP